MLIGVPENTAYDLRFNLLGIPVRVHPLFWVVTLILGSQGMKDDVSTVLLWVICVFVSIIVHEFGHAMMARFFGARPSVVLYGMGGLCYYDNSDYESPWRRIAVLLCGPGAGFVLFGLTLAVHISLRNTELSPMARITFYYLEFINLAWGILNLFPIWPMDGGQICVTFLSIVNRRNGRRWGHVVSLVTGGAMALWMISRQDYWLAFLFGSFTFSNYQILEAMQHTRSQFDDYQGDNWRR